MSVGVRVCERERERRGVAWSRGFRSVMQHPRPSCSFPRNPRHNRSSGRREGQGGGGDGGEDEMRRGSEPEMKREEEDEKDRGREVWKRRKRGRVRE